MYIVSYLKQKLGRQFDISPFFYLQALDFNINPNSAMAPKLGNIFSNLKKLTSPLNLHNSISIPGDLTNANKADDF